MNRPEKSDGYSDTYRIGEIITHPQEIIACHISGSKTQIQLTLTLLKKLPNNANFTFKQMKGILRGLNGYIDETATTTIDFLSENYSVAVQSYESNIMYVTIQKESGEFSNVTNNTPISLRLVNAVKIEIS